MLTVDIVAKKENLKDGKYPIFLRIRTYDKKYVYKFSKHWVPVKDWDEKKLCKGKNASYKNTDLINQKEAIEVEIMKTGAALCAQVKNLVKSKGSDNFYIYAESVLKEMAEDKESNYSPDTIARYESEIEVLRLYAPKLNLQDITPSWLTTYKKHRQQTSENNTVWATFKFIRKIIKKAFGQKLITSYPFYTKFENDPNKFKMPKYEETSPLYLTLVELDRMIALLDENYLVETDKVILVHFLLECTCGLRHSDWGNFATEKIIDRNSVKIRATKNGGYIYAQIDNSPRLKKVVEYIQHHSLTYCTALQTANKTLKYLSTRAKINKKITTHTGRHTCAVLHLEMGYSMEYVAELLGISLRVVKVYAKITGRKMVVEYDRLGGL
jgi:integrase